VLHCILLSAVVVAVRDDGLLLCLLAILLSGGNESNASFDDDPVELTNENKVVAFSRAVPYWQLDSRSPFSHQQPTSLKMTAERDRKYKVNFSGVCFTDAID